MLFKNITKIFITALTLSAGFTYAAPTDVHTWHNISVANGQWKVQLHMLNEQGQFYAPDGKTPISEMVINQGDSKKYGFGFAPQDDFNVAYTVTVIQQGNNHSPGFSNKACVFVVTAEGPAQPDITASSFKGALCSWKKVQGVGEDFFVS